MISKPNLTEALQRLEVSVKGGGSIVSHPPLFSPDSKTLYIIQSNTLLLFDTTTGRCIGKFCTPAASPIANIAHKKGQQGTEIVLVFTSSGKLLEVEVPSLNVVSTREVQCTSRQFPIISVLNFVWPSIGISQSDPRYFFVVAFTQDSNFPNMYSVELPSQENEESYKNSQSYYRFECKNVVANTHSVACGKNGRFVAAVTKDQLFVKDMASGACRFHKAGTRKFTCVSVHPTDWICATGDDSGRILVWTNILESGVSVAKSIYHWHTLPVADLCFSTNGSQIYSGGGECTLVKWELNNTGNKRTLPRLGLPIRHVRGAVKDDMIAISHADNSIQIVNAFNEVSSQIQNLTQCYIPEGLDDINTSESSLGGSKVFQTGLHLDPNNQSVVTNGRPGHLQCYSFREDRHLYNLDITKQNFITAERNNPIPNPDVTHVSFSKNGTWMATGETRINSEKCTELRLKFWKFERERQIFVLNTSIDWPHEIGINCLKIQPISDSNPALIAGTTGDDLKFKFWGIIQDSSIHGKSEWWNCEFTGGFRNLKCGPLSFSQDGSIVAIAFERILTVWTTENDELKLTLCHTLLPENINLLEFGTHQSSHLVITCSSQNIAVWDVITSSLLWVTPFHAESLAVDPHTNLAAAFSSKHHLIFFAPDESEPLAVHKNVSSSKVVSSIFVPHGKYFENMKLKSTLFFMNASQELSALLPPVEEVEETIRISSEAGKSVLTPFAQLIAEKTIYENNKRPLGNATNQVGLEGYKVLHDIMNQSPHTMPSLTYFNSRLLQSLSVRRTSSDTFMEMEKAVQASISKRKFKKSTNTKATDEDDDSEEDSSEIRLRLTPKESPNNFQIRTKFEADLDTVAQEDTTWIDKVFESL